MPMHFRLLCTAITALSSASLAHALAWDASSNAGQQDGGGSWLGPDRWWAGFSNTTWSDRSSAEFGNGGNGGSVSLNGNAIVKSIVFGNFNGTYTLSGGDISLYDGITKTHGDGAASVSNPLTLHSGNTYFSNSSAGPLSIGAVTGTAIAGSQTIDVDLSNSGSITISSITTAPAATSLNLSNSGFGLLTLGSFMGTASSGTQTINVDSSSSGNITLNGISKGDAGGDIALRINNTGDGATTLSGNSTFIGGVNLIAGMLNISGSGNGTGGPLGNGGPLTINGGALSGSGIVANVNPITVNTDFAFGNDSSTSSLTLPGTVDFRDVTRTITCNGTGTLGLSGAISGNGGIIKSGTGGLSLSGPNTFTGGIVLNSGTLNVNSVGILGTNGPLGKDGTLTINGGALGRTSGTSPVVAHINPILVRGNFAFDTGFLTLPGEVNLGELNRTITTNGGSLTFSGPVSKGGIIKDGPGTLGLSNPSSDYSGGTFINGGSLSVSGDGSLGAATGGVTFNGNSQLTAPDGTELTCNPNRTFTLNPGAQATIHPYSIGTFTIQGKVTGAGGLVADATSTGGVVFSNPNNDFTGTITTTSKVGTFIGLRMASISDVAGVGRINLGGGPRTGPGLFRWIGSSGATKTLLNRQFALNGTTAAGLIEASGSGAADNLVILKDLRISDVGNKSLTLGGTNPGNNTFAGNIADGPGSVISIKKEGSAVWTLSGNNSFSGGLLLNGGSVGSKININSPTALGTGTVTIANGDYTKLDNTSGISITLITNNVQTWNNNFIFIGSSDLNIGTGLIKMGGSRNITVTASKLTVGGSISGSGYGLTKAGNGTLALGGANVYTGTTTISGGTLTLEVDHALWDSSNVVIGSGILNLLAAVNNTVGTLDVTSTASQIALSTGATLNFANSSAVSWTGGTLNITGSFVPGSSIRFGTTNGGLTSGQLALIRVNGSGAGTYSLNANGYLTGNLTAYETWSGGAVFDADFNGDGVKNGLAWLLGAEQKDVTANNLLPIPTKNSEKLVMTFNCLSTANRGSAVLKLQYSNDTGISDPWSNHEVVVPGDIGTSTVNGVNFISIANGTLIHVMAEIPLSGASEGKLFGRISAELPQ